MWQILDLIGVPPPILHASKQLYVGNLQRVRVRTRVSPGFLSTRKGETMLPPLTLALCGGY